MRIIAKEGFRKALWPVTARIFNPPILRTARGYLSVRIIAKEDFCKVAWLRDLDAGKTGEKVFLKTSK